MKNRYIFSLGLAIGVGLLGAVTPGRGGVIFEATFAGPTNVTFSKATVLAGITGGTAASHDGDGGGTNTVFSILTGEPLSGPHGFMRNATVLGTTSAYATFTPAAAANSLNALFNNSGSQWQLNGGLDFFLRSDSDLEQSGELRVIDAANAGGLRLIVAKEFAGAPARPDLNLNIVGPTNWYTTYTGILKSDAAANLPTVMRVCGNTATNGNKQVLAHQIYHCGLTLTTDPAGLVTASLFLRDGVGAIDTTRTNDLIARATFQIDETVANNGFTTGPYGFGALYGAGAPKVQDFGRFRLYDAVPVQFEGLAVGAGASDAGRTGESLPASGRQK